MRLWDVLFAGNKAKEGQDLKEMELANSGLASTIIQIYWAAILSSYYNQVDAVRMAAVQVCIGLCNCSCRDGCIIYRCDL